MDEYIVLIVRQIHELFSNNSDYNWYNYKEHTDDGFSSSSFTDQGLIIKYSYGTISNLITPYGELKLRGSCSSSSNDLFFKLFNEKIMSLFDLKKNTDLIESEFGCYGPWYTLVSYNNITLPEPTLIYKKTTYSDYSQRKLKYRQLFN